VTGAQDFVQLIVQTGKTTVLPFKILVMVAQPNQHANQKQRMSTEYTAQQHLLPMDVLFHAKLWMD